MDRRSRERAARTAELRALGDRRKIRRQLIARDGDECQLCGAPLGVATPHIDHVLPRARGGLTVLDNLQLVHADCNYAKADGDELPASFTPNNCHAGVTELPAVDPVAAWRVRVFGR